jgi:hypothetical protein
MPLLPEHSDSVLPDLINKTLVDDNNMVVPEMTKAFGAAFRIDNEVGALVANKSRGNGVFDPSFDWTKTFQALPTPYQLNYSDNFALAENEEHFNAIKEQIDQEQSDREYLANSGWRGVVASLSAGILSPINLVPIGGTALKVGIGAKSVLEGSAKIAMAGAASVTAQELALHSQEETRTLGESAANVSIGALLSGVLGAGSYALLNKSPEYARLAKGVEDDFKLDDPNEKPADFGWSGGAVFKKPGVSLDPTTTLDQEGVKSAMGLEKVLGFQDPGLRLLRSPVKGSRAAIQNLAEISPKLNKNFDGIASPVAVESLRKIDEGRLAAAKVFGQEQYLSYKKRLGAEGAEKRLSYDDFMEAVSKASRRNGKSDIPEVSKVSQYDREKIYNHYKNEGMKIPKFFEEDDLAVTTAESYVNRMYLREKVVQNSTDFINRTVKYFKDNDIELGVSGKNYGRLEDSLDFADNSKYIRSAQDLQRNIVGAQSNVLHDKLGMSTLPKFTKSRKFLIKDEAIEDYLENHRDVLITQYSKLMSSRVRLAQKFGLDFLSDNFNDAKSPIVKGIKDEYAALRLKAIDDPKKTKQLFKQEEKDINDIFAVRDRLMGTYGFTSNPDSWLYRSQKQLKQFNVLRMLGDLTPAAFPDIGKLTLVSGFTKMFSQGVAPLVSKLKSPEMRAVLSKNTKELRSMGVALDLVTTSRANAINDIVDDFGRHSKAERTMDYLGDKFQKVTGIAYWNTAMKLTAGTMVQTKIAETMAKLVGGTATKREIADLASVGIDLNMAKLMGKQIAKHGEVIEGLHMPNLSAWDEVANDAAETYAAAVVKATDSIIVTPGVATTPLWMSRQGINLLGQFKSFAFSSVQKTMIPMLQDADAKTVQALAVMVGLGTLTATYKRWVSGQELPDNPAQLIAEGVDRSGALGWTMDANNMLEKMTGGSLGMSKILGTQATSRYAQRGRVESVLGPSAALLSDAMTVSSDVFSGNARKSTTHRVRKMIPYNTLFGVRQTLDLMEEEFNNSLGITKK